jgi:condensation domain-containing protein
MSSALTAKFEDVYPLTPFQQGVLFHVLDTPDAGMYLNQQRYTLRGDLDLPAFKQALQAVMNRHPILRTAFLLAGLDGPHQVVYRQVKLPWLMYDWSHLSPAEAAARVDAFLRSDFQSGFDLKHVPLNRTTLIRTAPDVYEFIWSFHLLLMDGWSMQVILRDLLTLYQSFHTGQPVELEPPLPYREFIKWQQRQPQDQAEAYWRKTLMGFNSPTSLVYDRMPVDGVPEKPDFKEHVVLLDEATTEQLRTFTLQHKLTLNTLLQGAWALLLSRRSGTNDVVFGSAVSGRSPFIPKIDHAVGVFVNVLPARVFVPRDVPVVQWLKNFQKQQAEARRFEFCSLANIHGWSDMPRSKPLFESVVVFQNFPTGGALPETSGIKVVGVGLLERNSVPLALVGEPGARMHLRLVYMGSRFDDATIEQMHANLRHILVDLATNSDAPLSTISYQADTERQFLIDSFNQSLASL